MSTLVRQVVELPYEEFNRLVQTQQQILKVLENLKLTAPPEFLTTEEFMAEVKISRWKFDALRADGKLHVIRRSRKLYVNRQEVARYFAGEME